MKNLSTMINTYENVIIIANHTMLQQIITMNSLNLGLKKISYKTFAEVIGDLIGEYDNEARIILQKQANITPELADIILKNTLLVNDCYQNKKIRNLLKIKNEYHKYLHKNPLGGNIYRNQTVIIVDNYQTNDLFNLALENLKRIAQVIDYQSSQKYDKPLNVFCFSSPKHEINNLVKEVSNLLEQGIKPEKIRISVPGDYHIYLQEVFKLTNLDLAVDKPSLYEYETSKLCLEILADYLDSPIDLGFQNALNILKTKTSPNNMIIPKIINIFNSYLKYRFEIKDIYQDLKYRFKRTFPTFITYQNILKIQSLLDEVILEDDYLFILGLNQDVFPKTYKDDRYLLDYERENLGLITSKFLNKQEKLKALQLINQSKNVYISYSQYTNIGKTPISSFIQDLKNHYSVEIVHHQNDYLVSYSEKLDHLHLGKKLDLYYKYDVKSEELFTLYNEYKDIPYRKYSHKFTGVDQTFLNKYLEKDINLSYTSIDQYYKCGFLFYLERVLKFYRSTNQEALRIGNLFHECLHKLFLNEMIDNLDIFLQETINQYLNENNISPSKREWFFINNYREILKQIYQIIKTQHTNSDFQILGLEKEYKIVINDKYRIILAGKIDKVLVLEINGEKYAVVIDYKTGNTDFDLNRIIHGLNMQIMFYFYFLNNSSHEKYLFGGGYLQGVLPNSVFARDSKLSYAEQFNNYFRLTGYSNSSINVLNKIDYNIENDQKFLNGIRFKKDGTLDANSLKKVISLADFKELLKITEQKINQAIHEITSGNYFINPKKLGSFDSCEFCPYLDLCYRDESDYQVLENYKNFEFLGGNNDSEKTE